MKFFPAEFEARWVKQWSDEGLFQKTYEQKGVTDENKMYLLYAFAYPSGSGLHVGHVEPVTALDILARYYRSIGKKVFFPVGWDAFGLPAENYAVKTGVHPAKTTAQAIENFSRQIKQIGVSYDWATEVATCHPGYYKWTQWLFLQMYKKGLAYKKKAPVNWCPSCQTVLANEQVVEGACERCGHDVIQKEMEQWFFKITEYKDELISGLDKVDWPKATKQQQLNWIGRKNGINITYDIENIHDTITCFTTRPDTNFGATFIVLAPEHLIVQNLIAGKYANIVSELQKKEVAKYFQQALKKTEEERKSEGKKKTGVFTGLYAMNNLNGKEMPVWVSDFVLAGFGTGAVVGVPGHDKRDFQFAATFGLPVVRVVSEQGNIGPISSEEQVQEDEGIMVNSDFLNTLDVHTAKEKIMDYLEEKGWGKRVTTYNLRDWLISRQRYWGAPIPIVYDPEEKPHPVKIEHLPWMLPTDVDFKPTGESPLRLSKEFKDRVEKLYGKGWRPEYDTMDTFVDSSWYYLRYCDPRNEKEFSQKDHLKRWMPVDFYMIGPEHIVLHLLYSRFFTKFLRDEGYFETDEPFSMMRHQGMILGSNNRKMSKSKGNVINPDDIIEEYGADTLRMYEMFMGPIDADKPWSPKSVQGPYRFLKRVWKLYQEVRVTSDKLQGEGNEELVMKLNKTIQKVGDDIKELKFNTAIAAMMEFLNEWEKARNVNSVTCSVEDAKKFLKILSPFAPFLRDTITISVDAPEEQVIQKAQESEKIKKYIGGGKYKKTIYVPGKILNIIIS
ncbi:MAG: Leucine-tRNA ligase [Candidatus Roizmanbacteria bacterium GW2011_GWA2_37_7]|uniref:Leucine--tRNA ligase n=1 Tax=Candidatus Roizmanbacteria bacterium GW2011_GWA2_37_7 TaxID=1618481 RepID=A0A0G0H585_9BACT|nr:MAG: Leucine-tRNA ligase [Candidatus Roizmanbacteria bacterium GW2011_GWA2_37_7]